MVRYKRTFSKIKKMIPFLIVSILALSALGYEHLNVESVKNKEDNDVLQTSVDQHLETDAVCPEAMMLSGPNGVIDYNTITFIWTGKDDTTCKENLLYSYVLKGKTDEWSSWIKDTSKTYENLPNGEYAFQVKAKDEAGNIDITPAEGEFIVDFEEKKPDDKTYEINWLIIEEKHPTESPIFVSKYGLYTKIIRIPKDNIKSISFELTWKDDLTALFSYFGKDTLTFSIKAPNGTKIFDETSVGNGKIKYTANDVNAKPLSEKIKAKDESDALSKLTKYYGTNWKNEPIEIIFDLKIGEKGIIRRLLDKGNDFDLSISYEYYKPELKDTEDNPPDTKILTGPSGTINDDTIRITWRGKDDITPPEKLEYSYIIEGKYSVINPEWSEWAIDTSMTYQNLPDGYYKFAVKARDEAGNIDPTPAQISFAINTENNSQPETKIISGPSGTIDYNDVTFTWTGSDDTTPTEKLQYSYKLEGSYAYLSWSEWTYSTSKTYTGLSEQQHTFSVRSMDEEGNIDSSPATRTFTVKLNSGDDTTPPETSIMSGPTGTINYDDVTFTWTGSDDATPTGSLKYSYKLIGKDLSWSSWTSSTSKTYNNLVDKSYIFQIKSKDEAGNIDLTPAQTSFTVETGGGDTTPPNTIINSGPTGTINYDDVTFTWTGNDDVTSTWNLKYSYKLIGKDLSWSSWTSSTSKTYNNLADKSYTFKVKAKDGAGNIDATPATRSFTVEVGGTEPNRFATSVIELNFGANHHTSYADPNKALGGPRGLGDTMGSLHVLSLGKNGDVTLGFDVTITNGPGKDFIVFENPFYINNLPGKVYAELMYVEVSTDGTNFARFPSISNTPSPGSIYPNDVTNLAGVWPVYANVDTNDIDPFNANVAGGDAFDLQSLSSHPLVQSGLVDLQNINYVRLIDILGDGSNLDSQGNPIYDPTDMDNGADLDAVAVINYT